MKLKTLGELEVEGKTVLLRLDLNSDVIDGKVIKGNRIRESIKTIKFLKNRKAKIVILAHQGNPGKKNFLSLRQHAKMLGNSVRFINEIVGDKAINTIKKMEKSDVILLDNIRFIEDEFLPGKKGNIILKRLLPLCDFYVNDAFSVSHRNHTSIVGFATKLPNGIGLLFEKEIRALEKTSIKNYLFILGGAKPESNIKLLKANNKILAAGLFGQVCLASTGFNFGYQNNFLKKNILIKGDYKIFLKKLRKKLKGVEMPLDFAVNSHNKRKELPLEDFPVIYEIDDLGGKTIEKYIKIIKRAKAIYMKGPVGFAEDAKFRKGTNKILRAIAACNGFSLVGGGQLSEAIEKSRIPKKNFGHVSLSGGALLRFIAGEKLIGLKVLGYYK